MQLFKFKLWSSTIPNKCLYQLFTFSLVRLLYYNFVGLESFGIGKVAWAKYSSWSENIESGREAHLSKSFWMQRFKVGFVHLFYILYDYFIYRKFTTLINKVLSNRYNSILSITFSPKPNSLSEKQKIPYWVTFYYYLLYIKSSFQPRVLLRLMLKIKPWCLKVETSPLQISCLFLFQMVQSSWGSMT